VSQEQHQWRHRHDGQHAQRADENRKSGKNTHRVLDREIQRVIKPYHWLARAGRTRHSGASYLPQTVHDHSDARKPGEWRYTHSECRADADICANPTNCPARRGDLRL
jgi:hypothetical protein